MFQMMQQHCGKFICTTLYFNRASKEQRKHVQIYHVLWDGNVFPLHVFKEDSSLGASLSLAPVSLSWQRMGELSLGALWHSLSHSDPFEKKYPEISEDFCITMSYLLS